MSMRDVLLSIVGAFSIAKVEGLVPQLRIYATL